LNISPEGLEYIPLQTEANVNNSNWRTYKYVADRTSDEFELIKIPELPSAYKDKNNNINDFVKGLLNSKYFIG
jgi:hypothetical protein